MELQCHIPFLLLDLGHPMGSETVNVIKKSLHNVLTLASLFLDYSSEFVLGISVMSSDYVLIQPLNDFRKNCKAFTKKLDDLDKNVNNQKTTVPEYRKMLCCSLRRIFKLKINFEKRNQKKCVSSDQTKKWQPEITIITRKTATILSDILMDIITKFTQEYQNNFVSNKNFKIVQILSKGDLSPGIQSQKTSSINWITCQDGINDLDCVFKDWLLRPSREPEELKIKFPKDIDLTIKCEVDVCVVEPTSFEQQLGLRTNFRHKMRGYIPPFGKTVGSNDLQILYRIPLSSLHSTLIFGSPRRIYALRGHTSDWNEAQTNLKIFAELCRQLKQSEQGLLVKSTFFYEVTETSFYYFITPDDDTLLLHNIAPEELYLPKNTEFLKAQSQVDESISSTVQHSLHQLQFLEKCSPLHFTSGLYEFLKNYITKTAETPNLCMCLNPEKLRLHKKKLSHKRTKNANLKLHTAVKNFKNELERNENSKTLSTTLEHSYLENFAENFAQCGLSRKRQKQSPVNKHPALLSPNTAKKYRKASPSSFTLPELGEAYDVNLN